MIEMSRQLWIMLANARCLQFLILSIVAAWTLIEYLTSLNHSLSIMFEVGVLINILGYHARVASYGHTGYGNLFLLVGAIFWAEHRKHTNLYACSFTSK